MFSVIIPAYNAAACIDECLDCICAAEEQDLEILVIDDGSTDGTAACVREHAARDPRIRLHSQPNAGVSAARNKGLDLATGEWIAFVDADDRISADFFAMTPEESACDLVQKTVCETDENGRQLRILTKPWRKPIIREERERLQFFVSACLPAVWNKLVRREAVGTLRFESGLKVGEDLVFMASLMTRVRSLAISGTGVYYYRVHSGSVIQQMNRSERDRIGRLLELASWIDRDTVGARPYRQSLLVRYVCFVLYHRRRFFTDGERSRLRALVREIRFRNLAYLLPKYRLRWLLVRSVLLLPGR